MEEGGRDGGLADMFVTGKRKERKESELYAFCNLVFILKMRFESL